MIRVCPEMSAAKDCLGRTPLHVASGLKASASLLKILALPGCVVQDEGGNTPLHFLCDACYLKKIITTTQNDPQIMKLSLRQVLFLDNLQSYKFPTYHPFSLRLRVTTTRLPSMSAIICSTNSSTCGIWHLWHLPASSLTDLALLALRSSVAFNSYALLWSIPTASNSIWSQIYWHQLLCQPSF
eukprot:scaffold14073_cov167-Skeletonema_dohrnii-CCMP3373.AAC.2